MSCVSLVVRQRGGAIASASSFAGMDLVMQRVHAHTRVNSISFSPDQTRLATCGDGNVLRVWDLTGDLSNLSPILEKVNAHGVGSDLDLATGGAGIKSVAYSPVDGTRLATVGMDDALRIWDLTGDLSSPLIERLNAHTGGINAVAYAPDGTRLATVGADGALRVWGTCEALGPACPSPRDLSSPILANSNAHGTDASISVAFSPDNVHLATVGGDNALRVWNMNDGLSLPRFERLNVHSAESTSVAYSGDGKRLATVGGDNALRVWNATSDLSTPLLENSRADGTSLHSVAFRSAVRLESPIRLPLLS